MVLSESLIEGFSHVSVKRTKLHSVVQIRLKSESRFGKKLLMLVCTIDKSSWFNLGFAEVGGGSYGRRGITFSEERSKT